MIPVQMPANRITLQFTGWKAVAVLMVPLAAAGALATRYLSPTISLPDSAQDAIKSSLRFEYTQKLTARYGITAETLPRRQAAEKFAEELAEFRQIEIAELKVRGFGRKRVAQFRVSVAGHTPPDDRSIRHMRITWSPLGDTWTAFPTAASAYYLAFW